MEKIRVATEQRAGSEMERLRTRHDEIEKRLSELERHLSLTPDERIVLALSDGSEEALEPATLTVDESGVLRARARGGKLEARLATSAAAALADRLSEKAPGRWVLTLAGRRQEIRPRPAASP